MNLDKLQSALAAAQHASGGVYGSEINSQRAHAMARYDRDLYGDEVKDRSTYVDATVTETVESIKPELVEIFAGGDDVVEFAPRGEEDVEAAKQETAAVNYVVNQTNKGCLILANWFHDALLLKNGYVKHYWDRRKTKEVEEYADLTYDEFIGTVSSAEQRGSVDILELEEDEEKQTYSVKVEIEIKSPWRYVIKNVPPEEILVHPEWSELGFEGCPFVAHKRPMSASDLVAEGFDRKQVESLPEYDRKLESPEANERFEDIDSELGRSGMDGAMREVLVYENYIMFDDDDDGVASLLRVFTAGSEGFILKQDGKMAIEKVDQIPFNVLSPYPQPHRHYGKSAADMVDDLARLRTVFIRQMVDNMVSNNHPEKIVDEDSVTGATVEDLMVTQPGRIIRARGGAASVVTVPPPQIVGDSLAALEFTASEREQRTGVTRVSQGLDANSLNDTFGGMKALMTASQKRLLLIARFFAETGVRDLFLSIHRALRKGPLKEIAFKLNNSWVPVSPRTWADRADMTVNVGLGTGDRDVQFQRLSLILSQQKEAMSVGMVEPKNIHHTLSKMLQLSGFKDVSAFFPEPPDGPMPQPEPQPDPAMMMAEVEQMKAESRARTEEQKMMADIEIEREKMALNAQLKREEMALKERIEMAKIENDAAKAVLNDANQAMVRADKNAAAATQAISQNIT